MAISFVCEHCGQKLRAKDSFRGRRVKCPGCEHEVVVTGERATPHDVFVSHSAADKTTADAICAGLEAARVRCWIAPRDLLPGVDWSEGIIDAINDCRVMVLVFSSHSNESPQVKRELERALFKGVPILPFRIEDVPLSKFMEYFIGTPHWLDAMAPPLERNVQLLVDAVGRLLAKRSDGSAPAAASGGSEPVPDAIPHASAGLAARLRGLPGIIAATIVGLAVVLALVLVWPRDSADPDVSADNGSESADADWKPLFDGRSLTGWIQLQETEKDSGKPALGGWSVRDGCIVCTGDTSGVLIAPGTYGDFVLELEFRLPADACVLVAFRHPSKPKRGERPPVVPFIHQERLLELAQADRKSKSKSKIDELIAVYQLATAVRPPDQWNALRVRCEGDRVQLTVNGTQIVDELLSKYYGKVRSSGRLGMANPEGMAKGSAFRDIRIRELK